MGKPKQYPSELLFNEIQVLSVRKLFLKTLISYLHSNPQLNLSAASHDYPTRHAINLNPVTFRLRPTIQITNTYILAHEKSFIKFKKLCFV